MNNFGPIQKWDSEFESHPELSCAFPTICYKSRRTATIQWVVPRDP